MMNNNNPWAGLASYEDPSKSERKLKFCGRDNDIYDVTRLIDDNLLLVLYGKSGIGKTSLLNAGVFPKLRLEQYLPVSIRLGILETNVSYQEAIISAIENAVEEVHGSIAVFNVVEERTDNQQPDHLWNYFARNRFANAEGQPLFPVVVLDQFEEVLRNNNSEHIGKAQTLLNQLQYLIDESHALNDCVVDGKEYFYDFNFRFVISIREDELYLLEDNIDDLSLSMFKNCRYRLRSLSKQGATEAILVPGKDYIADEEKQAIVDRIIELSKRPQNNDIDTLLLSLVCAGTYDKKAGDKITHSDLAVWKSNPMEVYYQDAIKGLSANQVRYIQQHLIREDGSRKRMDADKVKAALGENTYHNLTQGKNRMLVLGEHEQVELLHDQLALAVYEERKAFEERERKKRLRKRVTLIGIIVFAIVGIFFFQNHRLKQQRWKMMENQARLVAEKAKSIVKEDSYLARLLAIEVLPKDLNHPNRPYTLEAEKALIESTRNNSAIFKGHTDAIISAAFSPDEKRIVSASWDNTIRIWDSESGTELKVLEGHTNGVRSAAFSPDGKRIVSASEDNTVRIWDAESGIELKVLRGHTNDVYSAAFSPDGKQIVSASWDQTVRIWSAETGVELNVLEGHTHWVLFAAFSPDGKHVVSVSCDHTIRIWDVETGAEIKVLVGDANSATFSPNGKQIVSYFNNTVRIWEVESCTETMILNGHNSFICSIAFSTDGMRIVSASTDSTVRIWDTESGTELKVLKGHTDAVSSAAFSPDGKRIVSVSMDNTIRVWDAESGAELKVLEGNAKFIAFSPNGKRILLSPNDNTIRIWDTGTGAEIKVLEGHTEDVNSASFSPNGKHIVSASSDKTVRIWNTETGAELKVLRGHTDAVWSATFSPDGKNIVSASGDNTVRIWEAKSGIEIKALEGHTEWVNSISFSPDGKRIVSAASDDPYITIWDAKSGAELKRFYGSTLAAFSPDGKRIVSTSYNHIYIWDFPPLQELIEQTRERFKDRPLTPEERRMYYLE